MAGTGRHELVTTTPTDTEIVMTRAFDAPRDLVFEAHTSCEHMSQWWGSGEYEVKDCEIDFRKGGTWRIVHRGPNGEQITFFGEYLEIEPPERIVWTFGWSMTGTSFDDNPGGPETYTFEERDGTTTITARAVFPSKEMRDAMIATGMESGAIETYDRLEAYLEVLSGRSAD